MGGEVGVVLPILAKNLLFEILAIHALFKSSGLLVIPIRQIPT
jgi:hypothetical protein